MNFTCRFNFLSDAHDPAIDCFQDSMCSQVFAIRFECYYFGIKGCARTEALNGTSHPPPPPPPCKLTNKIKQNKGCSCFQMRKKGRPVAEGELGQQEEAVHKGEVRGLQGVGV